MKWSFRLFTVTGIEVRIHVTFFLLLIFYAYLGWQKGGAPDALYGLAFISSLFVCVLLHEFGHAFAARIFGIRTPDITLLPIGGVARLERMPRNPYEELVVALAGPAVNVVIAAAIAIFLGRFNNFADFLHFDRLGGSFLTQLATINILLVVFNMIPAFPMDGGRVLRALLAIKLPHAKATMIAGRVGQVLAVGFGIWGIYQNNFILLFIAMFVFMGAQQEIAAAKIFGAISRTASVGQAMVTNFLRIPATFTFGQASELARQTMQPVFPVVGPNSELIGVLDRDTLVGAAMARANQPLGDTPRQSPALTPDQSFEAAIELMQTAGRGILPVVNDANQVVGMVSLGTLMEHSRSS